MILSSLLVTASLLGGQGQSTTVSLGRVFSKYEKMAYQVRSSLSAQSRQRGLQTWIPEDLDMNYDFTTFVEDMKTDGIAVIRYDRPTIRQIIGETFNSPPKESVEDVNLKFRLTVSPINEILEAKDLNEKPKKAKAVEEASANRVTSAYVATQADVISQFVGVIFRLSLFVGSFDSALDFAPKTPFDAVKVGETWKRTVGYQPQKLKGKGNKQAVQRLDYTYVYIGVVESDGKKVQRVEASLDLKTDLAEFINQLVEQKPDDTGLKKIPLTMKSTIQFDLDMKTHHALQAQAVTESGFGIYLTDYPDDPFEEMKLKAHTSLKLVGDRVIPPAKKAH